MRRAPFLLLCLTTIASSAGCTLDSAIVPFGAGGSLAGGGGAGNSGNTGGVAVGGGGGQQGGAGGAQQGGAGGAQQGGGGAQQGGAGGAQGGTGGVQQGGGGAQQGGGGAQQGGGGAQQGGGGAGGSTSCGATWTAGPCGKCAVDSCCSELEACAANGTCATCLAERGNAYECDASTPTFGALLTCLETSCPSSCPENECNPVTNQGCDGGAGEACDYGLWNVDNDGIGSEYFAACYDTQNTLACADECDGAEPYCMAGFTCNDELTDRCRRYCCGQGDCDSDAACTPFATYAGQSIGVCTFVSGNTCNGIPMPAPSGGSCISFTP
jgi:hypothetical protein